MKFYQKDKFYIQTERGNSYLVGISDEKSSQLKLLLTQTQKQKLTNMLISNQKDAFNDIGKAILRKYLNTSNQQKLKLRGGGCSNGRVTDPKQLQKLDNKAGDKNEVLPIDFKKKYEEYINPKNTHEVIEQEIQLPKLFEICQFLDKWKMYISSKIQLFKLPVSKLMDVCLNYLLSSFSEGEDLIEEDQNKLIQFLSTFGQYIEQNNKKSPCMDLQYYVGFLIQMYKREGIDDDETKGFLVNISNFMKIVLGSSHSNNNLTEKLKEKVSGSDLSVIDCMKNLIKTVENKGYRQNEAGFQERILLATNYSIIIYIVDIECKKIGKLGNEYYKISIEDEILLLIELFMHLTNIGFSSDLILYLLTKIHLLLERGEQDKAQTDFFSKLAKKLPLSNEVVKEFILRLQQQTIKEHFLDQLKQFLQFGTQNPSFRFLSIAILMKYIKVLDNSTGNTEDEKEDIWAYLCNSHLSEKQESVQILFKSNQEFIEYVNKKTKSTHFQKKIQFQKETHEKNLANNNLN